MIWRSHATLKPATGQLVDWREDDIAFGPDRNIYTDYTGGDLFDRLGYLLASVFIAGVMRRYAIGGGYAHDGRGRRGDPEVTRGARSARGADAALEFVRRGR